MEGEYRLEKKNIMRETPKNGGSRKRDKKRGKGENCSSLHGLKNDGNLVLKVEEEEYQAPRTKHPGTTFHAQTHFLIGLSAPNHVQ